MTNNDPVVRQVEELEPGTFRVLFESGDVYEGGFVDGKREGKGQTNYRSGDVFEGDYHNDFRHGKGKYEWKDGSMQSGNWRNGLLHGEGEMFDAPSGQYYCGNFVDDNYTGHGVMIYGDRSKYEGEWLDDKRHGKGKLKTTNGNTYDGDWQNDKKHGNGIFVWADGKEYYNGEWQKGMMSGYGTYHYACGNHYQGDMLNDEEHGGGYMKYINGNEFQGEFSKGSPKIGIMCYDNGNVYEGELEEDYITGEFVPYGKGQMDYWEENVTYRGEWLNGKRHGQGTMYVMDDEYDDYGNRVQPRVYRGEWKDDMYYEPVRILLHLVNRQMTETRRSSLNPLSIRWVD
jgi:hypothetical protein